MRENTKKSAFNFGELSGQISKYQNVFPLHYNKNGGWFK